MNIFKAIGDFIVESWLWNFTYDWCHPVFTAIVMFFILRIVMRTSRIRSFLICVLTQFIALSLLSLVAIGLFVHLFSWEFVVVDSYEIAQPLSVLWPSIKLGIMYAVFNTIFFICYALLSHKNPVPYIALSWISNGIGAILSAGIIRMYEVVKYPG